MAQKSYIEWTDSTWNPVTGCDKISAGCKYCYAERLAHRLNLMGQKRYRNNFRVTLHEDLIETPLRWRNPRLIFVNSMSDLFHKEVPIDFIRKVFDTMERASQHVFQILTKRSVRLKELAPQISWPPNVWIGASVENQEMTHRIDDLRSVPAKIRFLSLEPLIGPITKLDLSGIGWVIVGGESGPHARPMDPEWARRIRDICLKSQVPFFFKQWGGKNKKRAGRMLDGRFWDQRPQYIHSKQEYLFSNSL
ncbi:MAG: phage Gp37/Gp68 family protein [Candidatus Marinimicrobia bacterium]|nr:phage Gp37/Gp68 family protein [Candidatus Neomarinimicrobiota bacterium]